jgi:hypothetical protein
MPYLVVVNHEDGVETRSQFTDLSDALLYVGAQAALLHVTAVCIGTPGHW